MNTSTARITGEVEGKLTADIVIGSVTYPIDTSQCDTHDSGSHMVLTGIQAMPNGDYHSVAIYLLHGTSAGTHPIGTPSDSIYASVSGEIAGTAYDFLSLTGQVTVRSINLDNSEVDLSFDFNSGDPAPERKVENGTLEFKGPKK